MQVIALTGGIAAGKSTIGKRFEQLGATRIDADELARAAVAPGSLGLAAVVERFGPQMLLADGSLDRAALGARVFAEPDALAALNAIVHPEVRRLFAERSRAAEAADASAVVVYEIPLLVETEARNGEWNQVVVAEADVETRVSRLVHLRGMAEDDARRRIANQATDAERRAVADHVIDTSGTETETMAQVDRLWRRLTTSG